MKRPPLRRFATALITTATTATLVSTLSSCGSDFEYGPYLRGLEEHCEQVAPRLVEEGAQVHCDDYGEAVIEDGGVKFKASEYGIQRIVTDRAVLSDIGSLKHGKIASFSVSVGGGYDAAKAGYALNDLSHPKPARWDDDPDWVLGTIRAAISTEEMKALVAQAERYQDLLRAELDNVQ